MDEQRFWILYILLVSFLQGVQISGSSDTPTKQEPLISKQVSEKSNASIDNLTESSHLEPDIESERQVSDTLKLFLKEVKSKLGEDDSSKLSYESSSVMQDQKSVENITLQKEEKNESSNLRQNIKIESSNYERVTPKATSSIVNKSVFTFESIFNLDVRSHSMSFDNASQKVQHTSSREHSQIEIGSPTHNVTSNVSSQAAHPGDNKEGDLSSGVRNVTSEQKTQHEIDQSVEGSNEEEVILEAVDVNATAIAAADEKEKEDGAKSTNVSSASGQLETYSQFAERVTAEKKNGGNGQNGHTNGQGKEPKVQNKNYASQDCGAKLISANPEANHAGKIIDSNRDEYLLNQCKDKTWLVIELCESIRPQKFDIANFELYSNLPKDIHLSGSHRYPTRDWTLLGRYEGEEGNRGVQSFHVQTEEFFKFFRIEVLSHYGNEFYCPLSLFRAYGVSEFEVIDEDDTEDDDDVEQNPETEDNKKKGDHGVTSVIQSMLTSIVKVIKRGSRPGSTSGSEFEEIDTFTHNCRSLHSNFAFENSKCILANSLNYILACYYDEYERLLKNPVIVSTLGNNLCRDLSRIICASPAIEDVSVYETVCNDSYICIMLSPKHVLAMCHIRDYVPSALANCGRASNHSENISTTPDNLPQTLPDRHLSDDGNTIQKESFVNEKSDTGQQKINPPDSSKTKTEAERINEENLISPESEKQGEATDNQSQKPKKKKKETADKEGMSDTITENENINQTASKRDEGAKSNSSKVQPVKEEPSLPTTPSPAINSPTTDSKILPHAPTNKESVIVRLSNKIKALEHNMSISSQYLEELSKSYKQQMITMLEKLDTTSQTAYERDLSHVKSIEDLEKQLQNLSAIISSWGEENIEANNKMFKQHLLLLMLQVVVFAGFLLLYGRRSTHVVPLSSEPSVDSVSSSSASACVDRRPLTPRRWSVDGREKDKNPHGKRRKQRRPSDESLRISGHYESLLISDEAPAVFTLEKCSSHGSFLADKAREDRPPLPSSCSAGVLFSAEKSNNKINSNKRKSEKKKMLANAALDLQSVKNELGATNYARVEEVVIPFDPAVNPISPDCYNQYQETKLTQEMGHSGHFSRTGSHPLEELSYSPIENMSTLDKFNTKIRLRSDNWHWYSAQQKPATIVNGDGEDSPITKCMSMDGGSTICGSSSSSSGLKSSKSADFEKKRRKKSKFFRQNQENVGV